MAHVFDCMRKIFLGSSAYRKITKISAGAYIFQRPFLRDLFFGGAYAEGSLRFKNRVRLAYSWKEIYRFFFVFEGTVFKYKPLGALIIRRGHLTEGFLS